MDPTVPPHGSVKGFLPGSEGYIRFSRGTIRSCWGQQKQRTSSLFRSDLALVHDAAVQGAGRGRQAEGRAGRQSWYDHCRTADEAFASTHADIWDYWVDMAAAGQFVPILEELRSPEAAGLKFSYGVPQQVALNYQTPPPPGFRTGRYINQEDQVRNRAGFRPLFDKWKGSFCQDRLGTRQARGKTGSGQA